MKKVGLTGGIGSGKTTITNLFKAIGIPVFVADIEARKLMENDSELIEAIKELLGDNAYKENHLNRKWIAQKVFKDKILLNQLNALVHPAVHQQYDKFCSAKSASYSVYESALIVENNSTDLFDFTILVTAPLEIRIQRVIERDSCTKQQVLDRMQHQLDDEIKKQKVNFVIDNQSSLQEVQNQVRLIHNQISNS